MKKTQKVALIGCGKMGRALLDGWLNSEIRASYIVVQPSGLKKKPRQVSVLKKPGETLKSCNVIVLAVKPQVMDDVCKSLKPFIRSDALIISIAAARSIKSYEKIFGKKQPIVRAMPNLPVSIGMGITVSAPNKNVSAAQKKIAHALLSATGINEWVKSESMVDAITPITGNGPAYVFYLIEIMSKTAEKAGLGKNTAMALALQTVAGSAALAHANPKIDAATLRRNVTSPGGTTEAAFKIMANGEMEKVFDRSVAAAKKRIKELSN